MVQGVASRCQVVSVAVYVHNRKNNVNLIKVGASMYRVGDCLRDTKFILCLTQNDKSQI